jgi:hypothetical protein
MLAQKREMQVAADGFSSPDGEGEEDIKPVSAAKHQAREPGRVVTRRASLLAQSEPMVAQESVRLVRKRMCMRLTLGSLVSSCGVSRPVTLQVEVGKATPETMPETEDHVEQGEYASHASSSSTSETENSVDEGDDTDSIMTVEAEAEHYVWDETPGNASMKPSNWHGKNQNCGTYSG